MRMRILLWLVAGLLLGVTFVRACSIGLVIWGLQSKTADPLFRFVQNRKAGFIDSFGKIIIPPVLSAEENAREFHEGLLAVKNQKGFDYLDRSGVVAFHTDAWLAFDFSEGLAPASRSDGGFKWGFIDRAGQFAIPPQYSWVDPYSEGLARVSVAGEVGSTGYIDHQGQFVIPPNLSYGSSFREDRAAVIVGGPCRIVNGGSCARAEFRPTVAQATYDCRYAFIDKNGQPISDLRFDDALDFSEGLAPVRIGQQWGYVDPSGQISIPLSFHSAESFSEGLAAVNVNGKVGFIDHSGNFVITPQFDTAYSFSDGRALVSAGEGSRRWSFIDKTGNLAIPGKFSAATSFNHGLAHVALDEKGRFAWIDTSGNRLFYDARQ